MSIPPAGAATLFVANLDRVNAIPLAADGSPGAASTVVAGLYSPSRRFGDSFVDAISAGPGGAVDVASHDNAGTADFTCGVTEWGPAGVGRYAPTGGARCTAVYGLSGRPSGAIDTLAPDGVYRGRADGTSFERGAFARGSSFRFFAEDGASNVYAIDQGSANRVQEFATVGAGIGASPVRTITLPGPGGPLAVGPDGIVYAAVGMNSAAYVVATAPDATAPSRTIGPFANVTALAVDAHSRLYVATTNVGGRAAKIRIYAGDASGNVTPLRTLLNVIPYDGRTPAGIRGIAVAYPPPPASETLYVTERTEVLAYPATANGPTAAQRTITGFTGTNFEAAVALATDPNGQLFVVRDAGETPAVSSCAIIVESPAADGATGVLQKLDCGGSNGEGIARGSGGQIDVLERVFPTTSYAVHRFAGGAAAGSFAFAGPISGFATDAAGNVYVIASANRIDEYAAAAPNFAAPIRSITIPAGNLWGGLTVAPDGTVYAGSAAQDPSMQHISAYVYAVAPGQALPSRTIGPFNDDSIAPIAALACDAEGDLYVALNASPSGSKVDVFLPNADAAAAPVRTLPNPVPIGSRIQAIALGT